MVYRSERWSIGLRGGLTSVLQVFSGSEVFYMSEVFYRSYMRSVLWVLEVFYRSEKRSILTFIGLR